jgi:polyisoprenoid-binding protein YceI
MKTCLIVIVVLVLGFIGWKLIQTKPNSNLPSAEINNDSNNLPPAGGERALDKSVNNSKVEIGFKGFGPGKEHTGKINTIKSNISIDTNGLPMGEVEVDINSITTDTEAVTKHLKNADFFDTEKYPTATFVIKNVIDNKITGTFSIHGVTKDITFPFITGEEGFNANFNLDMKEFGIEQKFANSTVEVILTVPFN